MPKIADRVKETSTTTGTGTLTLSGAQTGFRAFSSAFTNGDEVYYAISNGTDWEVGFGVYSAGTLTRATILCSSNANALVSFAAGAKDVFSTLPAEGIGSGVGAGYIANRVKSTTTSVQLGSANYQLAGVLVPYSSTAHDLTALSALELPPLMYGALVNTTFFAADAISNSLGHISMAFGGSNYVFGSHASSGLWYSPDLETWTQSNVTAGNFWVCYAAGVFVAYQSTAGSTTSYTSTDGVTWTARTCITSTAYTAGVVYGSGLFVIPLSSTVVATSPDGITWTSRTVALTGAATCTGFAAGNGLFLLGAGAGVLYTSPDGITWTSRVTGSTAAITPAMGYVFGAWWLTDTGSLKTSTDGTTWTTVTLPASSTAIAHRAVITPTELFLSIGVGSPTAPIFKTTDGSTFTYVGRSQSATTSRTALGWINGRLLEGVNVSFTIGSKCLLDLGGTPYAGTPGYVLFDSAGQLSTIIRVK